MTPSSASCEHGQYRSLPPNRAHTTCLPFALARTSKEWGLRADDEFVNLPGAIAQLQDKITVQATLVEAVCGLAEALRACRGEAYSEKIPCATFAGHSGCSVASAMVGGWDVKVQERMCKEMSRLGAAGIGGSGMR